MLDSEYRRMQRVDPDSDIYASGYDPMAEQLKAEGVFKGPDGRDWVMVDPSMINGTYQLQQYESGNAAGHRNMIMSNAQPVGPGGALAVPRDIVNQSMVINGMRMSPPQRAPGLAALSIGGILGAGALSGLSGGAAGAGGISSTAGIPGLGEFVPSFLAEGGLAPGIAGLSEVAPTLAGSLGQFGAGVGAGLPAVANAGTQNTSWLSDLFKVDNPLGDWSFDPTNPTFDRIAPGEPGAAGGFQTVPPPGTATPPFQPGFNILDPATYGSSAATAAASAAGSSIWSEIAKSLGGPFGQILSAGAEALGEYFTADQQKDIAKEAARLADPFAPMRPIAQQEWLRATTDPNYYSSNPTFQGITGNAVKKREAEMAAQGYSGSGNILGELTKVATNEGFKYALPHRQQLALESGANFGPTGAANLYANYAGQAAGGTQNILAALGTIFGGNNNTSGNNNIPNLLESLGNIFGGSTLP